MKTKEFIKRVEDLGFGTWITGNTVYISKGNDETIARVEVDKTLSIDFVYPSNKSLAEEIRKKLFNLVVEYASTPVKDREEEKKFYLRHKYLRSAGGSVVYFTICVSQEFSLLKFKNFSDKFKQQFTLKEIEEIKEKFDTDLKDFELVEAKE